MMRYSLVALFMVLSVTACVEEEHPPIAEDKMMAIMEDIHMAEVYSTMVNESIEHTNNKNIDSLVKYYNIVFQAHDITLEQFDSSVRWYANHPKDFDSLYVNMLPKLNELEGLLANKNQPE